MQALMQACDKDDYDKVRLLVSFGYRLRLKYLSSQSGAGRAARGESGWSDFWEMPFQRSRREGRSGGEDREDDMYLLNVLRMMARCVRQLLFYL